MRSTKPKIHTTYRFCTALCGVGGTLLLTGVGSTAWAADNLLLVPNTELNQTQTNMARTISTACSERQDLLQEDFRNRCNALITDAQGGIENAAAVDSALETVSPEQTIAPSTQATRTTSGQVKLVGTTIQSRLQSLRTTSITTQTPMLAELTGGAAGIGDETRLSSWISSNYHFGDVDSSSEQIGFDFDSWGGTVGLDYRLSDNFLLGTAFSYLSSDINFDRSGGGVDGDTYTGSLYGTFYITDALYMDAVASYGGAEYDIDRVIRYTIPSETINTKATGSPDGSQYSFSLGGGYDYSKQNLTISPFARVNYLAVKIDGYSESGGLGWAQKFAEQNIQSLTTEVGAAVSYAFSIPTGVIVPQIKAKWLHEFKDNSRRIKASYLADPGGVNDTFNITTQGPDRNYFVVGADISSTFSHGISAFFAYNALLGYHDIDSHQFTLGGRLEF